MAVSTFDLFKIGIGPSSSHTVGPMRAAARFVERWLVQEGNLEACCRIKAELFGSLALTGKGHGSDKAVLLGLEGQWPHRIDPDDIEPMLTRIRNEKTIHVAPGNASVSMKKPIFCSINARNFPSIATACGLPLFQPMAASWPIVNTIQSGAASWSIRMKRPRIGLQPIPSVQPYPFKSSLEMISQCEKHGLTIADLMRANESVWRSDAEIDSELDAIWQAMKDCLLRGTRTSGVLPGGLKVTRRAPLMLQELLAQPEAALRDPLTVLDWVNLYALAVNEENAAGGRVVTAPTNGAAGIIPAVLHYYDRFCPGASRQGIHDFLLTAAAIGILYKENASISGAEVGCQGEVGVACSMAAGGLTAALGGSLGQIENAAEIGMEHNLGLTCDPIGGLVQIPCIERNAMGSVKAINASRLALRGDGKHTVSLDKVIKTMRDTGRDMAEKYKETSRGGLAVNVIEC